MATDVKTIPILIPEILDKCNGNEVLWEYQIQIRIPLFFGRIPLGMVRKKVKIGPF